MNRGGFGGKAMGWVGSGEILKITSPIVRCLLLVALCVLGVLSPHPRRRQRSAAHGRLLRLFRNRCRRLISRHVAHDRCSRMVPRRSIDCISQDGTEIGAVQMVNAKEHSAIVDNARRVFDSVRRRCRHCRPWRRQRHAGMLCMCVM